jgi:hypothetical protein
MGMDAEEFIIRLLPVLSNLVFLWPAERALKRKFPIDTLLWSFIALFSSPAYHLCMGFYACLWAVDKHRVIDFWSAEMAMPIVALCFIAFRAPFIRTWIIFICILAIGLLVTGTNSSFMSQAVIAGVSGLVVIFYRLWHRYAHEYWPEYDMKRLVLGIGFLALGVCFFVVQEWWPPFYGYVHAYWHVFTALGIGFMYDIQPEESATTRTPLESQVIGSSILKPIPRSLARFTPRGQLAQRV